MRNNNIDYWVIENQKSVDNIHSSMRLSLAWSQIFGFFPVQGVLKRSHKSLKFSWLSLLTAYSLFSMAIQCLLVTTTLCTLIESASLMGLSECFTQRTKKNLIGSDL
jgi:hypothetical protein